MTCSLQVYNTICCVYCSMIPVTREHVVTNCFCEERSVFQSWHPWLAPVSFCVFYHFPCDFHITYNFPFSLVVISSFIPLWLAKIPASPSKCIRTCLVAYRGLLGSMWLPWAVLWSSGFTAVRGLGPWTSIWTPHPLLEVDVTAFSLQLDGRSPCTSGAPTRCACGHVWGAGTRPSTSYNALCF